MKNHENNNKNHIKMFFRGESTCFLEEKSILLGIVNVIDYKNYNKERNHGR